MKLRKTTFTLEEVKSYANEYGSSSMVREQVKGFTNDTYELNQILFPFMNLSERYCFIIYMCELTTREKLEVTFEVLKRCDYHTIKTSILTDMLGGWLAGTLAGELPVDDSVIEDDDYRKNLSGSIKSLFDVCRDFDMDEIGDEDVSDITYECIMNVLNGSTQRFNEYLNSIR
jgi:hypothetical protein